MERNKPILVLLVLVIIIILLIFVITYFVTTESESEPIPDENTKSPSLNNESNSCYSNKLPFESNPYINAKFSLAFIEPDKTKAYTKPVYQYIDNKTSFTMQELVNYAYGFEIRNAPGSYYIDYEICDIENNKTLSYPKLFKRQVFEKSKQYASPNWQDGLQTNFAWESADGIVRIPMDEAGKYAIDVYASAKEGDWKWVDRLKFEVK